MKWIIYLVRLNIYKLYVCDITRCFFIETKKSTVVLDANLSYELNIKIMKLFSRKLVKEKLIIK